MAGIGSEYDNVASLYNDFKELPTFKIEWQLAARGLGDCTGLSVLDLGGGSGLHARQAVDLGAKCVDIVDVSSATLEEGKSISARLGRSDPFRWLLGDMLDSLDHLPLEQAYDIVLVGWTFDHAETDAQLEAMWKVVSHYTKPGGKLVNLRVRNVHSAAAANGKYGVRYSDLRPVPGGCFYNYHITTGSSFSCSGSTMHASMDFELAKKTAERHGFTSYREVAPEQLDLVKADYSFWELFLEDPFLTCVTARKKD